MPQVYVDPEELENFANKLVLLIHELDDVMRQLQVGLQRLSSTWRDQEYDKFVEKFLKVSKLIEKFSDEIQNIHPQLRQDAEFIREYIKLQK